MTRTEKKNKGSNDRIWLLIRLLDLLALILILVALVLLFALAQPSVAVLTAGAAFVATVFRAWLSGSR